MKLTPALLFFAAVVSCVSLAETDDQDFFLELTPAEEIQQEILKGQASLLHTEHEHNPSAKQAAAKPAAAAAKPAAVPLSNNVGTLKAEESNLVNEIVEQLTHKANAAVAKHASVAAKIAHKPSELDMLKAVEQELVTKLVEKLHGTAHEADLTNTIHELTHAAHTGTAAAHTAPAKVVIKKDDSAQKTVVDAITKILTSHSTAAKVAAAKAAPPAHPADPHKFTVVIGNHAKPTAQQYEQVTPAVFHSHLTDLINHVYKAQKENCLPNHPCYAPLPKAALPPAHEVAQSCDSLILPANVNITATMAHHIAEGPKGPKASAEKTPVGSKHLADLKIQEGMLHELGDIKKEAAAEEAQHKAQEEHLKKQLIYQAELAKHSQQNIRMEDAKELHKLLSELIAIKGSKTAKTAAAAAAAAPAAAHAAAAAAAAAPVSHAAKPAATAHVVVTKTAKAATPAKKTAKAATPAKKASCDHPPAHNIQTIRTHLLKLQAEQQALQQKLWIEHNINKNTGTTAPAHPDSIAAAHAPAAKPKPAAPVHPAEGPRVLPYAHKH